ncbi:hypothetical protein [Spartinivicinus poritis]|uniref:Uncharacterized protein n=1 Tax=Spartinivicinus poritis TaxID=2994640 RepID=A0ABT5UDY8_9GAMM|nr:hypothetical protein [Spartinivicinus sp. A2-2]MDE1463693.1 hypothetical protein [Spartinivicinus sp. A2-2]
MTEGTAAVKHIRQLGCQLQGKKIVVVLSGRNIALEKLLKIIQ